MHAADSRCQAEWKGGQDANQEAVAELGAAVLARLFGARIDAHAWKYVSQYTENPEQAVRRLLPRIERAFREIFSAAPDGAAAVKE